MFEIQLDHFGLVYWLWPYLSFSPRFVRESHSIITNPLYGWRSLFLTQLEGEIKFIGFYPMRAV